MAYRRCLLIRGYLDRKCRPSFSYVLHRDERKRESPDEKSSPLGIGNFIQLRSFGSSLNESMGFVASSRDTMLSNKFLSPCSGYNVCRYMSTINEGSDNIDIMIDVTDVLTETTIEAVASQAPIISEVAIAAADCVLPVKLLQYMIDGVHFYTGLNWWAAIALTTLLIRCATVPILINQHKIYPSVRLSVNKVLEIMQQDMDPAVAAEGKKQLEKLINDNKYVVNPSAQSIGMFIEFSVVVSYFFAITNMAEKMPSFKHGGAYWFIDLTTPDALYIFPVLTALSSLMRIDSGLQQVLEGRPLFNITDKMLLAVPIVLATMGFSKAIFCYWVTSNLFSIIFHFVLKDPGLRKYLGLHEISTEAPTSAPQPPSKKSNKK